MSVAVKSFLPSLARGSGGSGFVEAGWPCATESEVRINNAIEKGSTKRLDFIGRLLK
jgi:hypothetical protein